jgi:hypothetical protein
MPRGTRRPLFNAIDADGLGRPVKKISAAFGVRLLAVIAPGLHMELGRRLDADVDVFREAVDDPMTLHCRPGQASAALPREREPGPSNRRRT